jgi:hypothetical protein
MLKSDVTYHVSDPRLRKEEPLWATEPSEGRVGRQVGLACKPHYFDVRDVVAVIRVKECTVHHWTGKVGRTTCGLHHTRTRNRQLAVPHPPSRTINVNNANNTMKTTQTTQTTNTDQRLNRS